MEKKLPTQGPDARMEKKLATQGPHADTGQIATYNRVCRSRGIEAINWQRFAPYPLIGSLPPSAFLRVFLYQAKFNCFTSQCVRYILFWWKHRNRVLCAAIIIVVRSSCGRLIRACDHFEGLPEPRLHRLELWERLEMYFARISPS